MNKYNKRKIYIASFAFLGILLGFLFEMLIELFYTKMLLSDFKKYSFGLSWVELEQVRDFAAILLLFGTGAWGFSAGKYWWHQIYELKVFKRHHWNWL